MGAGAGLVLEAAARLPADAEASQATLYDELEPPLPQVQKPHPRLRADTAEWRVNESSMKSYSQMKRSTLPVRSPLTREKGQQNQESRQPAQRDKSTKSVQETVINKTVSNQGSKRVNIIQGKTTFTQ